MKRKKISLIELMKKHQFREVKSLLRGKNAFEVEFDRDETDYEGVSLLEYAIIYKREDIALLLLDNKYPVHWDFQHEGSKRPSPIGLAVKFGCNRVLAKMIEQKSYNEVPLRFCLHSRVYDDIPLLVYAVMYENLKAVKILLEEGVDVGIRGEKESGALAVAAIKAIYGDDAIFRELLKAIAGLNFKGRLIEEALADLRSYSALLKHPEDISRVETILESAAMY